MIKNEIFRIENLYGSYFEQMILDKVAFSIFENEILCIFGFSNSGKTTLANILSGQTEGTWNKDVFHYGRRVRLNSLSDARAIGIFYVRSYSNVFPNLTVAENIYVKNTTSDLSMHYINHTDIEERTGNILSSFGLHFAPSALASDLAPPDRFMLEIIDAALNDAKIIVLDCIQHFTSKTDLQKLRSLLRTLCNMGISIVYTCNTIDEARLFADRIIVMRNGMKVKEFTKGEYTHELLDAYGGGQSFFKLTYPPAIDPSDDPFFIVNDFHTPSGVVNISLSKKETLVLYGRSKSALQHLADSFRSNKMLFSNAAIHGKRLSPHQLEKWLRKKCCIIDSLSCGDSIFPNLSMLENITVGLSRRQVLTSKIKYLIYQSNRELIKKAENEAELGQTSIPTNMSIILQRILLGGFELCIFIKPELGLDPISKIFVLSEIKKLCEHNLAVIIMTDNATTIEKLNYRTLVV